jgi:hypothetical protein
LCFRKSSNLVIEALGKVSLHIRLDFSSDVLGKENIAEIFQLVKTERTKSKPIYALNHQNQEVKKFRKKLFLYYGMNLGILKLPIQTQVVF